MKWHALDHAARAALSSLAAVCVLAPGLGAQVGGEQPWPGHGGLPEAQWTTLSGETVRLQEAREGPRVIAYLRAHQLLSRRVLADLQAEWSGFQTAGIDVLVVVDSADEVEWRRVVSEEGIDVPLALDHGGRWLFELGRSDLPLTLIVDAHGRLHSNIHLHRSGYRRDLARRVRQAARPGALPNGDRQEQIAEVWALVLAGLPDDALASCARIAEAHAGHAATRAELGRALLELDQPQLALAEFEAWAVLAPRSRPADLWKGIAHARSGRDAIAADLLLGVVELVPEAWRGYGELARIEWRRGNVELAAELYRRGLGTGEGRDWSTGSGWVGAAAPNLAVLDLDGQPGRATVNLSGGTPTVVLFWRTDDAASSAALEALRRLGVRSRGDKAILQAINVDRWSYSRSDRAHVLSQARSIVSGEPRIWLDAALESSARYDVHSIPTTIVIDPAGIVVERISGPDLGGLASVLQAEQAKREAAGDAPKPVDDRRAERYLGMARHLARVGHIGPALDAALRSIAESPAAPPGSMTLVGRLLLAEGRVEEALAFLLEATRSPTAGAWTAYGDGLALDGRGPESMDAYRQELAISPRYGPARLGLGRALPKDGSRELGLQELRLAVAFDPHDEPAQLALAALLEQMDCLEEALDVYELVRRERWERETIRRALR